MSRFPFGHDEIRSRFDALRTAPSPAVVAAGAEQAAAAQKRGRQQQGAAKPAAEEQDNALSTRFNLTESEIYRILLDTSLDKKQMFDAISKMLLIDFDDPKSARHPLHEKFGGRTDEVRAIIKKLVADYNEHSRECTRLSRDNPLAELKKSLQSVMENYRDVVRGRTDLKDKVDTVEKLIAELGGEKELVKAIVDAIDNRKEIERLQAAVEENTRSANKTGTQISSLENSLAYHSATVRAGDGKWVLTGQAKRDYRFAKGEVRRIEASLAEKRAEQDRQRATLATATEAYQKFAKDGRLQAHEKVLKILDIGGEDFKKRISALAQATLTYVDDTEAMLTGVHGQLEVIRGRTSSTLDVNANIGDKVEVLRRALEFSAKKNTTDLKAFKEKGESEAKAQSEAAGGIEELRELGVLGERDRRKIEQAAHGYVSDLDGVLLTTTTLADQLQNLNVSLLNLKDIVEQGLTRAETQQIIAVTIATQSGQSMLDGAQALAALVQALINEGQFQNDAEHTFEEGLKLMERSLLAKGSRVESIDRMAELTRKMSAALDTSNDATLDISLEEKKQLHLLGEAMEDLKAQAERKVGMPAEVIDAYGRQLAAGAPAPQPQPQPGS